MSRSPERAGDRPPAEAPTPGWQPLFHHGAALSVYDAGERHAEIARVTGLAPTNSHLRGDRASAWSDRIMEHDHWSIKSPLPRQAEMSAHLRWVWEQVAPHAAYFRSLVEAGFVVAVWCFYTSDCDHCGFTLEPGAVEIVTALGVPLHVSTILLGREDGAV